MSALAPLFLSPLGTILIRWTLLLAVAWFAQWQLRNRAPQWRLVLWRSVLVFGLLVPLESLRPHHPIEISITSVGTRSDPAIATSSLSGGAAAGSQRRHGSESWAFARPLEDTLMGLWALGAIVGILRLIRLNFQLMRLRRRSRPAGDQIIQIAREMQNRLRLRQLPKIRNSTAVSSPFVGGLQNPVIYLPDEAIQTLSAEQLTFVLCHEMAHLRSRDLPWSVAWQYVRALWWFHPLVWKAAAMHSLACEQRADELVTGKLGDATGYLHFLAQFTLRAMSLPPAETVLTMNGSAQITQRLSFLRRGSQRLWTRWHSLGGTALTCGLLFIAVGWGFNVRTTRASEETGSAANAYATSRLCFYEAALVPTAGFLPMTFSPVDGPGSKPEPDKHVYVATKPILTLADIAEVRPVKDRFGHPQLWLRFTPAGRQRFKDLTTTLTAGGKRSQLAVVLDGQLKMAPTVVAPIDSESAEITGNFDSGWLWSFVQSLPADKRSPPPPPAQNL